ncbi:hypothetical protein PSHT_08657 [Puccinia striiformis]|uniref:Uncharacterized protein n=1 Tax=Puccinia striiformis TaxID=27350 RepID=A0A2S4VMM3_9BASI|nr:hypothetical protein PSHT_08657 [Puccinia striiformis]
MVNDAKKYASQITSNNSLESYPYNLGNSGLAACLSVLRIFNQPTAAPIAHFLDFLEVVPWISPSSPLKSKPPLVTPISEERISTPVLGMPFFHQLHDQKNSNLNNSTKNLLNHKTNFYDGILTIPGFQQIKEDPVPKEIDIIPNSFGPFIGRSKPCKRKIRQRNREDKVAQVSVKIIKTEDCIHSYAKVSPCLPSSIYIGYLTFVTYPRNGIYTFPS